MIKSMITVALASHRPETLALARERMSRADVVVLPGENAIIRKSDQDFPHTMDEIEALKMLSKLDMEECQILFEKMRLMERTMGRISSAECRKVVKEYLDKRTGSEER